MDHHVLVAFGHGVGAPLPVGPREAAEKLRLLIDKALSALGTTRPADFSVSVGPNGVMLAFPGGSADRALQLVEAVQAQAQSAQTKGRALIPVCCVITFGPMRPVDVLGYSSNFEGRPAIAAARVLARLPSGQLAVEESAWELGRLAQDLGDPETLHGKHPGEAFRIRIHRRISFPVDRDTPNPSPQLRDELRFQIAFTSEERDQWRITPAHAAERLADVPWKADAAFGIALNEFFSLTDRPMVEEKDHQALAAHAARLGDGLAGALLRGEDLLAIRGASQEGSPPLLTIESDDDLILSLPWELLRFEGAFAVKEARIDLVRTVPSPARKPITLAPPDQYLKLLVLVSAPEGSRLNYEAESFRITRALHDYSEIVHTELGTVDDLVDGIVRRRPIGVHFSGHGGPGTLSFENEEGEGAVVAVVDMLRRIKAKAPERIPRFFYLASCHGNTPLRVETGQAGSLSSAAQLHREGNVQVVGYFGPIVDELSTRAEVALYRALADGRPTRDGIREARTALAEPLGEVEASHRHLTHAWRRQDAFPFAWAQLVFYHRGPDHPLSLRLPQKYVVEQETKLERSFQGPEERRVLATGFIGRRRELHRVRRTLREGRRILVFQGLGGLGKTTLAFRILPLVARGRRILAVWCRELEKEENPAAALVNRLSRFGQEVCGEQWGQVVQAVDQFGEAGDAERFQLLFQVILQAAPHLVVYLDNLESLRSGPDNEDPEAFGSWRSPDLENIWQFLEKAAGDRCSILASCRYRNPSFNRHIVHVGDMGDDAIFRMMGWFPGLRRLSSAARARLVARLHGHPRAVDFLEELIAPALARWEDQRGAWTAPSTRAEVEQEWRELVVPALPQVEGPLRQDLLFDRIWDKILQEPARRMLYRMTLLRRPWDWDLMKVLGEAAEEATATERTASRLRDSSLLGQVEERDADGRSVIRFQLHPTTARFIQERLAAQAESLKREAYLRVGTYLESLARTSTDLRVYLDAGHYLFQAQEYDRAYVLLGWASELLQGFGRVHEGLGTLQPFLRDEVQGRMSPALVGRLQATIGGAYIHLGQIERAIDYLTQALAISREMGNVRDEGNYLGNLGVAYVHLGQFKRAIKYHKQALAISREIGERHSQGSRLANLGNAYARLGNIQEAVDHYLQALAISREFGDRHCEGAVLGNLGNAYLVLGQIEEAIDHYIQALAISRNIDDRYSEGSVLLGLGSAYAALGQVERAIEQSEQSLVIAREIKDPGMEGAAVESLRRLRGGA